MPYEADELAQLEALNDQLGIDYPKEKEKHDVFKFLNDVFKTKDTTQVSNVDTEELRVVRVLKDVSSYAKVWNLNNISEYFKLEGEDVLASADSKDGFLVKTAVTQRKQFETKGKSKPSQGGGFSKWFKKKEEAQQEEA
jgi:hypothetical protein